VLNVVWTNRNYETVRLGFSRYGGKMEASGHYAGMYLGDPDIDYVKLAESQGVKGEKANHQAEFEAALKRGIQATKNGNCTIDGQQNWGAPIRPGTKDSEPADDEPGAAGQAPRYFIW
jgi:thiamine pyrophosphate-dependent acetolactate synthase large subunit-like protein